MMRTSLSGTTICTTVKTEGLSYPLRMEPRLRFVKQIAIDVKYDRSTLGTLSIQRTLPSKGLSNLNHNERHVPITFVSMASLKGHLDAGDTFCVPTVPP